jgi:SNF2 family DNA or RNA helicase
MISFRRKVDFQISPSNTEEHLLFLGWSSLNEFRQVAAGKAKNEDENLKFLHLQSLVEQGVATWDEDTKPRGILMDANEACILPPNLKTLFGFPPEWNGLFKLIAPEPTHSPTFNARIEATPRGGRPTSNWTRKGNLLMIGNGAEFSLNSQQLMALLAYEDWKAIDSQGRAEADNQILLAKLQKATRDFSPSSDEQESEDGGPVAGAKIDIGFPDLEFGEVDWDISIKEMPDGGLQLVPTPASGETVVPDDIIRRLDQFKYGSGQATIRLNRRIITLTKEQTKRTRDILSRGRLSPEQKKEFLKDPNAYLAEYIFDPDDIEWSPRVRGIAEWEGSVIEPNVDGGMGMDVLGVEKKPKDPEKVAPPSDESPNPDNPNGGSRKNLDKYLPYPHLNMTAAEFSECLATERVAWGPTHPMAEAQRVDETIFREGIGLKAHQEQGVRWMLAHAYAIDSTAIQETPVGEHFADRRGGVLLADDMGLGKTISVLSVIAMRQKQLRSEGKSGAFLVVAPVSLLLNWKAEFEKFFRHEGIFDRIVVLHTDHELQKYRIHPKSADQLRESDDGSSVVVKSLGLKISNPSNLKSLGIDSPGSIVITNYETIQRFRFSFCAAKWEILALDEAQATKNPNVMRTASIKALNARFRILMTGTPVENSLVDFWCLNDTHSPGLFCSLQDFRHNYIARIRRADPEDHETRRQVAAEVKGIVGETMLRRMKKEILDKDFPKKIEHRYDTDEALAASMDGDQLQKYDSVRLGLRPEDSNDHHLALLHELRLISLHPDLSGEGEFPVGKSRDEAGEILRRSVKGRALMDVILPEVKGSSGGEKVLIFAISKSLQWGLARNLEVIYPELGRIPIINGDTKIKTTRANPSRQKLIEDFEKSKGFNICILSPIAAGVGLTITAANHVVHYERHWNPAKEAQATDRAYRIGQTKDVHVWYPIARHPDSAVTSFDQALDRLMQRKISLQDSILSVEDTTVDRGDLVGSILGGGTQSVFWNTKRLGELDPLDFEALIACLYFKMGASKTELTVKSGDKGADVVAWNYPTSGSHCLVDAKHVSGDRPLASADGVKQVHAAGSIYGESFGEDFSVLQVVTNSATATPDVLRRAEACKVEILTGGQLLDMLSNHEVTKLEIMAKLSESRISIR